jgi:hypothetical protein
MKPCLFHGPPAVSISEPATGAALFSALVEKNMKFFLRDGINTPLAVYTWI